MLTWKCAGLNRDPAMEPTRQTETTALSRLCRSRSPRPFTHRLRTCCSGLVGVFHRASSYVVLYIFLATRASRQPSVPRVTLRRLLGSRQKPLLRIFPNLRRKHLGLGDAVFRLGKICPKTSVGEWLRAANELQYRAITSNPASRESMAGRYLSDVFCRRLTVCTFRPSCVSFPSLLLPCCTLNEEFFLRALKLVSSPEKGTAFRHLERGFFGFPAADGISFSALNRPSS
ncbi:hypothetical protein DFS34DRAFT_357234 [Phlyctochytrium arcticum]|nr:hypothetical protein DFS34DRAFT_357234 [Phlyctochytrium arcticum]